MRESLTFLIVITLIFHACQPADNSLENVVEKGQSPLFILKDTAHTGLHFSNHLREDFDLNYFNFGYIYNGGGVAIGDINNDGLPDVYLSGSQVSNRLFLNKGGLRFEDITEKAGVGAEAGFKTGVVFVDINADGLLDIYACRTGTEDSRNRSNLFYINNGDLTFSEQASALGLDDQCPTNHAVFFDYDGDGDLDLYLLNHPMTFGANNRPRMRLVNGRYERITEPDNPFESDRLYRNDGVSFSDQTATAGITNRAFGLSCTVADFNNDAHPDIFVANDFIEPDFLYINRGDGTFEEQYSDYFRHICHNSMGSDLADFDNDGDLDLVVLDMIAEDNLRQKTLMSNMQLDRYNTLAEFGYGRQCMRNVLQQNNDNGTFSDIGLLAGISNTDWSWGPLFADFNNDGWKDLFIANGYRRDVTDLDFIKYKRDSLDKNASVTVRNIYDFLDKIPSQKIRNYMFMNNSSLRFEDVSLEWGFAEPTFSNGTAYGDLDQDGDLDLVINNLDMPAMLYENRSSDLESGNYLRVRLSGPDQNLLGIGTEIRISTGWGRQYQRISPSRGFFSFVEPVAHFGVGSADSIDFLEVIWPDGKYQKLENLAANQSISIHYKDAGKAPPPPRVTAPFFRETQHIEHLHQENEFEDFKRERLLPHRFSTRGPGLAVGDVNGDDIDDVFIGGALGQPPVLYLQKSSGVFIESDTAFAEDEDYEDVSACFFDADGDGDRDLYVASGGNENPSGSTAYRDRLYLNDGSGHFSRSESLPPINSSTSCAAPADFDGDGDLDLFVGGSVIPGQYPLSGRSYLLENSGGQFRDVTNAKAPDLENPGIITDAAWADLNGDGLPELIICGEWLPISVYSFQDGIFSNKTASFGLENTHGWWTSITAEDLDGDGDTDLFCGNFGLNSRFKASIEEPLEIYARDFDENGNIDPVICQYIRGESWPVPGRDVMVEQIPALKKDFLSYRKYALASIEDLFDSGELSGAYYARATHLESALFENDGQGRFAPKPLPVEVQISPVWGMVVKDFDDDGIKDMLVTGNFHGADVESGPYDAGNGAFLKGQPGLNFEYIPTTKSGFFTPGDSRNMAMVNLDRSNWLILVVNNDDVVQTFTKNR